MTTPPLAPARSHAPLAVGIEAARGYVVVEHLARGADLDVYEVHSVVRDCRCVAKAVRPDRAGDADVVARLTAEGRLLLRLTHPHIVRCYEVVAAGPHGGPLVVLETLGGATLAWLARDAPRPLAGSDLAHLGLQLASALQYLHRHRRLHLDLKPANVVAELGLARILDLSLARPPGEVPAGYGTAQYLAPEQARGGAVDTPADVWGLGATLWAAATGRRPFDATGREQLTRRAAPLPRSRRLPPELRDVVGGCLEPDPADRPDLAEVRDRLSPLAG